MCEPTNNGRQSDRQRTLGLRLAVTSSIRVTGMVCEASCDEVTHQSGEGFGTRAQVFPHPFQNGLMQFDHL